MIRPTRDNGGPEDPISVTIPNPLATKIRTLHAISKVGDMPGNTTSLQKWCIEIIENFIVDKRKGVHK